MSRKHDFRESREEDHEVFPSAWYAVAWAKEVTGRKPVRRRLAGRELVLYRSQSGQVHALHAFCPHRGADLSLGHGEGENLRCAYHAWCFAGDGECLDIPAHPDRAIPEFAHTKGYPVTEKADLIWVYPEDRSTLTADPAPLELYPEVEDSQYTMAGYDAVWNAHLTRVVESVLDTAHVPIVHRKTIGRNSSKAIHIDFQAEGDDITIWNGAGRLDYRFPQQWLLSPSKPGAKRFINFVTFTPVDKEMTAIFGLAGRNFARLPGVGRLFSRYSSRVLEEDRAVVESQHPRPIPDALRLEAHVPADGPQVRFRQRWYDFLESEEPRVFVNAPPF
ncbi:aromatic ring-hydroxylating dioxygenase subunit alpha [Paenibacillus aurantius]|uniref:Aromatic ring-hydroxylating dioxygenase subunit alpha n=1 Tax=Paenibacillus aurantius TaxID=2918900 RepID=A0AA96LD61_9BACL|nr:aromatic ring-hydroxylating dioxygenase subunit alpha [Paenibacillus aurantius]WNQ11160.1 aromatic ring-hydroxylating dioxygenase subunit alpha [Paenibacillus aurantius]